MSPGVVHASSRFVGLGLCHALATGFEPQVRQQRVTGSHTEGSMHMQQFVGHDMHRFGAHTLHPINIAEPSHHHGGPSSATGGCCC